MVSIEDLADVILSIEDTYEDEEDKEEEEDEQNKGNEGGPGWSAMASMCKHSVSLGRKVDKRGEEDQWLNIRSFLGSFLRFIFLGFLGTLSLGLLNKSERWYLLKT